MPSRLLVIAMLSALAAACGSGAERSQDIIKVYQSDGSKQCEGEGRSVNAGASELRAAGIDVICGQKGHDGFSRAAVCGEDTGKINIYSIHAQNQPDAESLGYGPVSDLPEYRDEACRR